MWVPSMSSERRELLRYHPYNKCFKQTTSDKQLYVQVNDCSTPVLWVSTAWICTIPLLYNKCNTMNSFKGRLPESMPRYSHSCTKHTSNLAVLSLNGSSREARPPSQRCVSARERSGSTYYHYDIGEKMCWLVCISLYQSQLSWCAQDAATVPLQNSVGI